MMGHILRIRQVLEDIHTYVYVKNVPRLDETADIVKRARRPTQDARPRGLWNS